MKRLWTQLATLSLLVIITGYFSQVTTAAAPSLVLSQAPIYTSNPVPTNVALALSVEFPTVGPAYKGTTDYSAASTYLGYFNDAACYKYKNSAAYNTATQGSTASNYLNDDASTPSTAVNFFYISSLTVNHDCTGLGAFSGNYLNWVSTSAIDILRVAMSGGDRIIDTTSLTVLQRAYLSVINSNFYNNSYAPRKTITGTATVAAATPFSGSTTTVYSLSCRNRIYFGTGSPTNCDDANGATIRKTINSDNDLGQYLARVQVCDTNDVSSRSVTTPTYSCTQYPNSGNPIYKPTGLMQQYSGQARYAAFGYLMDASQSTYGGVLRAPMKFLGPTSLNLVSNTYQIGTNTQAEWSADTGIYATNPLNDTSGNSGVINYLNKFGRTNTSNLGGYKGYDPFSEMFYEVYRYFQGLQPTSNSSNLADAGTNAIPNNVTTTQLDGYPAYSTWTDPVIASCQKNFTIAIGDENTWYDGYLPGNNNSTKGNNPLRTAGSNDPNVTNILNLLAAFENQQSLPYTDSLGNSQSTASSGTFNTISGTGWKNLSPISPNSDLANISSSYVDSLNGTWGIAALAYWMNTQAFRINNKINGSQDSSAIRVSTYVLDVDESGNGTFSANPVQRSQLYMAAKYGGFTDTNSDGNPFRAVDPFTGLFLNDNSEWSGGNMCTTTGSNPTCSSGTTTPYSIPQNYFLASQPTRTISGLKKIFAAISKASGTISGISLSSSNYISGNSNFYYKPSFTSNTWSGSLGKYAITLDPSSGVPILAVTPTWDAGSLLASSSYASRKVIFTSASSNVYSSGNFSAITALPSNVQTIFNTRPYSAVTDSNGQNRMNWLLGDQSKEVQNGGSFRNRTRILGDIVNSAPLYVGAPNLGFTTTDYQTFANNTLSNGGFSNRQAAVYVGANDGMLHAFNADTGSELFAYIPSKVLGNLPNLTSQNYVHQAYVDAPLQASDWAIENISGINTTHSWKTALVGGLGSGGKGLFALDITDPTQFSSSKVMWEFTDADDSDMGFIAGQPKIERIQTGKTSGGIPIYQWFVVAGNGYNSTNNQSVLFLIALNKGASTWTQGSNYFKIVTSASSSTSSNGLAMPGVATTSTGNLLYAYAGDLLGNLWKFNFTNGSSSGWSTKSQLLLKTTDSSGAAQPITTSPVISIPPQKPTIGTGYSSYVIAIGTGKYLELNDAQIPPGKTSFQSQSFYGVWDGTCKFSTSSCNITRSNLIPRSATVNGTNTVTVTGNKLTLGLASGSYLGWYVDFPESTNYGERNISSAALYAGLIGFSTIEPTSNDLCKAGGRRYQLNVLTGLPTSNDGTTGYSSTIGLLGPTLVYEVGNKNYLFTVGSGTNNSGTLTPAPIEDAATTPTTTFGTWSWRRIFN